MRTKEQGVSAKDGGEELVTRRILKEELGLLRKETNQQFVTFEQKIEQKIDRKIDQKIDGLAVMIKRSFDEINSRFDEMSNRFDRLEARVAKLEKRVDDLGIRMDRLEKMFWGFSERFEDFKQEWELWASKREQRQIKTELKKYQYAKNETKKDKLAFNVLRSKVTRLEEKVAKLEKEKARN